MTMDNGMDVQPSWQELKAQLEVAQREVLAWKLAGEVVEASRDALSAHVERLTSHYIIHDADCARECGFGPCSCGLDDALSETPTTSLARLKAHATESLVPHVADEIGHSLDLSEDQIIELEGWLGDHAERRQAQEPTK